jgi:hypothetical protein
LIRFIWFSTEAGERLLWTRDNEFHYLTNQPVASFTGLSTSGSLKVLSWTSPVTSVHISSNRPLLEESCQMHFWVVLVKPRWFPEI